MARKVLMKQVDDLKRALDLGVTWQDMQDAISTAIKRSEIALSYMTRESVKPVRAKAKSEVLNSKLAEDIRRHVKFNPGMSTKDVANIFNVNQGRVTEALQHKV
jgi:predicted XRE-type DNA-binding protein